MTPAQVSGRGLERVDPLGHLDDVAGVGVGVLAEAAVDRVAHVLLLEAERLPAGDAVLAGAAGVAEPRHRDSVAERDLGDAGAELDDDADALVAGMNGGDGLTGQSPCAAWMSVWQSPDASILTTTSPAPGIGMGFSSIVSGSSKPWTTAAFIVPVTGSVTVASFSISAMIAPFFRFYLP